MAIIFDKENRIFKLDTLNSSYVLGICDAEGFVGQVYFGKKIDGTNCSYLLRTDEAPFVPSVNNRDRVSFVECFPFDYPGNGCGNFRGGCIAIRTQGGHTEILPLYVSHKIVAGKPKLKGMPSVFAEESQCSTLQITCQDQAAAVEVVLSYTAFENLDVIVRSAEIKNIGNKAFYLTKALSACLNLENDSAYDIITLHGSWARERHPVRRQATKGTFSISSFRGESGHQENPFMALASCGSNQESGQVYGLNLVYSGNFVIESTLNQFNSLRTMIGINPEGFCWKLEPDESFFTPEAVMVYSDQGIGGMTRTFHNLYRNHLIRSPYKFKPRPVLLNSWEAVYFDFNTEKLLDLAKQAAKSGIELFVLDDGWFGKRNDDNTSLGDWYVNTEKLKGGLELVSAEVHRLGMKFGLWFEPEMISPDSDLYRKHPDWAIAVPKRTPSLARNQYVLDLSRKEVVDYVYDCVSDILRSCQIEYVKWDMNRPLTDIGSAFLPPDRQGELFHRYVLGVYELQERLVTEFPDLLLENCSGGGARFDPGMLYYSPQIWCSDNTDAVERLSIQEGTAMVYPLSCMGAHVSVCPNHTVGRTTPFSTRGFVALAGTFGYELDVTKLSEEEKAAISTQIEMYHKYGNLVRSGDYYRLASYSQNREWDCWQVVSKDKEESLVIAIQVLSAASSKSRRLCLRGLEPFAEYTIIAEGSTAEQDNKCFAGKTFYGSLLMNAGILIHRAWGDFQGTLFYLKKCSII